MNNMKTKQMEVKNNKLYMGDFSLEELAKKYQTPLYVYDEEEIKEKVDRYNKGLSKSKINGHVVYASKAFIAPYLLKILNEKNCYIDAISVGDLYIINKSNFPMEKVVLHGNNKSIEDLDYAVKNNVGFIVCDNLIELDNLLKLCIKYNKKVNTLFRVNPGIDAHTHKFIQTSKLDSKFGESIYDLDKIDKIISFYKNQDYMKLNGFHAHIGSQITSEKSFVELAKTMAKFYNDLLEKYNITFDTIDFGGGIAIKYLDSDTEPNIEVIVKEMINVFESNLKGMKVTEVFLEPGRSIVGDAGITLYTCGGVKRTFTGVEYAFIDGGMSDNIRPALYQALYTIDNASRYEGEKGKYHIAGKHCESGDLIIKDAVLTKPEVNDILCVYSTGAYCYSMSMNYNGLTRGGVIFVSKDKVKTVIKRETVEDLAKTCVFD